MKSFTLSKEVKEQILLQLTIQAIKKHIPAVEKALKAVNKTYWDAHVAMLVEETGLSADKFPHLIQRGIMTGAMSIVPMNGSERVFHRIIEKPRYEKSDTIHYKLMWRPEMKKIDEFFVANSGQSRDTIFFCFSCDRSVPRTKDMEQIGENKKLVEAVTKAGGMLNAMLDAAADFHEQAKQVLLPIRTSTQLIDAFPEAAKLLVEPVRRTNELAPIEQVNRVREMLNKGVPDKLEAA